MQALLWTHDGDDYTAPGVCRNFRITPFDKAHAPIWSTRRGFPAWTVLCEGEAVGEAVSLEEAMEQADCENQQDD